MPPKLERLTVLMRIDRLWSRVREGNLCTRVYGNLRSGPEIWHSELTILEEMSRLKKCQKNLVNGQLWHKRPQYGFTPHCTSVWAVQTDVAMKYSFQVFRISMSTIQILESDNVWFDSTGCSDMWFDSTGFSGGLYRCRWFARGLCLCPCVITPRGFTALPTQEAEFSLKVWRVYKQTKKQSEAEEEDKERRKAKNLRVPVPTW